MVVAHTEISAMNAEGRTIYAMFNFSLNNKTRSIQPTTKEIEMFSGLCLRSLTPKIPGPFLPISTSKMPKFSKKSQKKFKK
jgi:hypothetical protein